MSLTIRQKLLMTAFLPVAFTVILVVMAQGYTGKMESAFRKSQATEKVIQSISELSVVMHEYILYRENRPLAQWEGKNDQLKLLLSDLYDQASNRREKEAIERMGGSLRDVETTFMKFVNGAVVPGEWQSRLVGQLLVKSHTLSSEAFRFSHHVRQSVSAIRSQWSALTLLLVILLGAVVCVFVIQVSTVLQRKVKQIRDAARAIGRGEWNHRIMNTGNDELGQLGDAFNDMARQVRFDLQRRKDAEAAVRKAYDKLEMRVKERTRALSEAKERYDLAVNASRIGVWEWYPDTDKIVLSQSYLQLLGDAFAGPENMETELSEWLKIVHPEDHATVQESARTYLDGIPLQEAGAIPFFEAEFRLRGVDGKYRWVLTRGTAYRDDDGIIYKMAGTHIDISDRKAAEEALRELSERLAQSNHDLEQFAYVASHDLQEPLRTILAFTELLSGDTPSSAREKEEFLTHIRVSADRMRKLIEDLLHFSRITKEDRTLERVELKLILEEVLYDLDKRIRETKAEIHIGPMPVVGGNSLRMKQLFQNLITNALKFRKADVIPRITIASEKTENEIIMSVRDNGIGFERSGGDKIFQPFRRLHHRRDYEGSGIGLAVCEKIVKQYGGRIWADSQSGKGAAFFMAFPWKVVMTPESIIAGNAEGEYR